MPKEYPIQEGLTVLDIAFSALAEFGGVLDPTKNPPDVAETLKGWLADQEVDDLAPVPAWNESAQAWEV